MASQADPANETKRLVKMSLFFNKKADLTDEEFHRYWSDVHGPLFMSLPFCKEKIVKYVQYHNDKFLSKKAASLGLPVMDEFDGVVELWAEDMETLVGMFKDPGYLETMVPDEDKLVTREGSQFMFGYDDLKMAALKFDIEAGLPLK